jgi:3-mercaptopyruvate sulfurtransferase SseA
VTKTRSVLVVAPVLASALVLAAVAAVAALSAAATVAGQQVPDQSLAPRIVLADFKKAFDAKAVVILDVRDASSYAAGHIPGAILVPLEALAKQAPELKTAKKPIVAYCA